MSQISKASSILLARGEVHPEFLLVRRSEKLRFFGGFYAFPGGRVSPADAQISIIGSASSDVAADRCVAVARELFEETGILLARNSAGSFPESGSVLDYVRKKLSADEMSFAQILERLAVRLHASAPHLGFVHTAPAVVALRAHRDSFGVGVCVRADSVTVEGRHGSEVLPAGATEVQAVLLREGLGSSMTDEPKPDDTASQDDGVYGSARTPEELTTPPGHARP